VKQTIDKGRKGMSALLRPEDLRLGSLVPKGKTVPIVLPKKDFITRQVSGVKKRVMLSH
jgi:hypothetical protein